MSSERKKVLKMLDDGKIDLEEANQLLSTLDKDDLDQVKADSPTGTDKYSSVKINVIEDGQEKVNITLPLRMVKLLKKLVPERAKDRLEDRGIQFEDILTEIENETFDGKLIDINDGTDHVEIKLSK